MNKVKYILKEKNKLICFEPIKHRYFYNKFEFISVNKLLGFFSTPFDPDGRILKAVANRENVPESEIKAQWEDKKDKACALGTKVHDYAEKRLLNIPEKHINKLCGQVDNITVDNVIDTECILYSDKYAVSGTTDFLTYNNGKIDVCDWKTNSKDIQGVDDAYHKNMLRHLCHLSDTTENHYAMQLSMYALMLEDWGFEIGDLKIYHIQKNGVKIFTVPYLKDEARKVLEYNIELTYFL